jgi:hypothetical protein
LTGGGAGPILASAMTRYWLRFDDLCPTMNRRNWERAERILDDHRVRPLLAVVPENRDPALEVDSPDPAFWDRARSWQERGWVVGLHGLHHVYDSRAPSLLPFKTVSEFSGHPLEVQSERIGKGLEILRGQGLDPKVWVAPGHAFDAHTLEALRTHGLNVVSDGFGFRPYRDEAGMTWIPQQTRRPRAFPFGTVTIALHTNEMDDDAFDGLERFLAAHRGRLVDDFDALVREARRRRMADRVYEGALLGLFRYKWRKQLRSAG